jgi:RND family efflux transporter MFP subunit
MTKKRIILIGAVLIAITTLTFISLAWKGSEEGPQEASLLPAPYINPVNDTVDNWDEYIGRFAASERVEIRSKVNGYIESVNFKDGDLVKKGQVLFVIDQRPFYIALKQAEAEKLREEADLTRTQSDYQRIASVQDSRAVSREEVEQRQQLAKSAEAQLMAANANLAQARLNLSYTEVRAPISGKISDDFIDQGNYITGGATNATLLTTILKIDPIHFYFEGNETDFQLGGGQEPQPVTVKLSHEDSFSRQGTMDFVDNEFNQSTGTIRGRAVFDNPGLELQSGMFGRLQLIKEKTSVIMIPDEAIGTVQSQKIVYAIGQDSTIKMVPVELGKLYRGKYRIVTNGLTVEDKVITGNLLKIMPGMKVIPEKNEFSTNGDPTGVTSL